MATKTEEVLEIIKGMTILELKDLNDQIKEEFGVTAMAPMAVAAVGAPAAGGGCCRPCRGGADRVHRRPQGLRRQQDQRHQGGARGHHPRPQGGQGPGRGRPDERQGRRRQGRGRDGQGQAAPRPAPPSSSPNSLASLAGANRKHSAQGGQTGDTPSACPKLISCLKK